MSGTLLVVPLRVLIIDDNERFVASATRLLRSQDTEVVGVGASIVDAEAALQELKGEQSPHVVLLDVDLGPESGFQVARHLARLRPTLPIILISTHGEDEFLDFIAESSAIAFLPKAALSADAVHRALRRAGR